jgi:hypothetical protein
MRAPQNPPAATGRDEIPSLRRTIRNESTEEGVDEMLLPRQELVDLLQEEGDIGTARQAELSLPEQIDTLKDRDLLNQLRVNVEDLLDRKGR